VARSISALPAFIPVRSDDGAARAVAFGLVLDDDDMSLGLVIHDLDSNRLRVVDAALWRVDRSLVAPGVIVPGQALRG
jgi:hypothetical protein